jgi:hypothetical protein
MFCNFQLWYDAILVGSISEAFLEDETWYGKFCLSIAEREGERQLRLCDFIGFSKKWNERIRRNEKAEAREFDHRDFLQARSLF